MPKRKQHDAYDMASIQYFTRMRNSRPPSSSNSNSNSLFYFFVKTMNKPVIYLSASPGDTVFSIHERVSFLTGIPIMEQSLVYQGKQLRWEQTLRECRIEKDSQAYMVGRLRSIRHRHTWRNIQGLVEHLIELIRSDLPEQPSVLLQLHNIQSEVTHFLTKSLESTVLAEYTRMITTLCVPFALVMIYVKEREGSKNKEAAQDTIKLIVSHGRDVLPQSEYCQFVPIVLEFCRLLEERTHDDDELFLYCRSTLAKMLENMVVVGPKRPNWHCDLFMLLKILAEKVCIDFRVSAESGMSREHFIKGVADLSAMLGYAKVEVEKNVGSEPFKIPLSKTLYSNVKGSIVFEITALHSVFVRLLSNIDKWLIKLEDLLNLDTRQTNFALLFPLPFGTHAILKLLKELYVISKLYHGCNDMFLEAMKRSRHALCHLLFKYAKRTENHAWITECEGVSTFEVRRHLALLMLPGEMDEYDGLLEMLIDRSQLLEESFEYVLRADLSSLLAGLSIEFKNEDATGPGVLREWFLMVCQAIFNPQNGLFVACPADCRRFYPNRASKVNPKHLDYFKFSGRVIALAFRHKIQVGILLDRVFIAQLAGLEVTLEDVKDADPHLYSSWKKILEMDPEIIDQNVLGLTFIDEIEELGVRESVNLCENGENVVVNSANRKQYINALIQHRFVKSINEQVWQFSRGFADVVDGLEVQRSFFKSLRQDDLDLMLHGSENEISVDDWMAHTDYLEFHETDTQISWFWEVVKKMTSEQKKVLLYFWTSIKYLPMEGFRGLSSRLYIVKTQESVNRLPSSHTCFYQLCFPAYPSFEMTKACLTYICQDHVSCSFGTW